MSAVTSSIIAAVVLGIHSSVVVTASAFLPRQAAESSTVLSGDTVPNQWHNQPNRLLALRLITTSLTLVVVGTAGVTLVNTYSVATWAVIAGLTLIFVLAFEALPSRFGRSRGTLIPETVQLPTRALDLVLSPVITAVATLTESLFDGDHLGTDKVSREEIVKLLDGSQVERIDPEDRQMIQRILELPEMEVCECMTPLVEVVAVPHTASISEAIATMVEQGHSRIPVYRDRIDNIVGLITHRDVLFLAEKDQTVTAVMRQVHFVPESKSVDEMLHEMRMEKGHFSVVVDEYGGTVGVITLEDLIEEIVGEIQDERDTEEPGIRMLSPREWRVPARYEIEDVEEVIGIEIPEGNFETLAGYILNLIGRIPEAGEIIRANGITFRIEQSTDRAIHMVHLTLPRESTPS